MGDHTSVLQLLQGIWDEYDADKDGNLNAKEAKLLLEDFTGRSVDEVDCTSFLRSIDADGDALIQIDELDEFITKGIHLSKKQRSVYQERGNFHQIILEFFDSCIERIKALENVDKKPVHGGTDTYMEPESPVMSSPSMPETQVSQQTLGTGFKDWDSCVYHAERRLKETTTLTGDGSAASQDACKSLILTYNQGALELVQDRECKLKHIKIAEKWLEKASILCRPSNLLPNTELQLRLLSITLNNTAVMYKAKKMPHAALQCLDKALRAECKMERCPNPAGTHLNLCATLSAIGRHRAALSHAVCAIDIINATTGIKDESKHASEQSGIFASSLSHPHSVPRNVIAVDETNTAPLLTIAYYNKACQEEHLGRTAQASVTAMQALQIAKEDPLQNQDIIFEIKEFIRDATMKKADNELQIAKAFSQTKSSRKSVQSSPASPRRVQRPVNSQDELNMILRKAVESNRSLFGMKLENLQDVFLAIDKDNSGTINFSELKSGLKRLGVILSDEGVQGIMDAMDPTRTGEILYDKWVEQTNKTFTRKETKRHTSTVGHTVVSKSSIKMKRKTEKLEALKLAMTLSISGEGAIDTEKNDSVADEGKR